MAQLLLEPEVRLDYLAVITTTVGGKAIILFLKQPDKKLHELYFQSPRVPPHSPAVVRLLLEPEERLDYLAVVTTIVGGKAIILLLKQADKKLHELYFQSPRVPPHSPAVVRLLLEPEERLDYLAVVTTIVGGKAIILLLKQADKKLHELYFQSPRVPPRSPAVVRLLLEPEVRLDYLTVVTTTVGGKAIILFLKQPDKKIT